MKLLKMLFATAVITSSTTALAHEGSERSQQMWQAFKAGQVIVHGDAQKSPTVDKTADTSSPASTQQKTAG